MPDFEVPLPLTARELTVEDLPHCGWTGSPTHLRYVAAGVERARTGASDYLALCPPSGLPVAVGQVDYEATPGAGALSQLVVHPALRSLGIGTALVAAAERRIVRRGLRRAVLGVEDDNPRARALYERLGYVAFDREPASWDAEAPDGTVVRHDTVCQLLEKDLPIG